MSDIASVGGRMAEQPSPPPEAPAQPSQAEAGTNGKGKWLVLVAMVFGLFMPMLDNLVFNQVALGTMQQELDARVSDLQWIIDAYTLTFASFMLIGGSMGDILGRKKFFIGGLLLFTLGSVACGLSESTEQLVAFRTLQGLGAALVLPGSLSILTAAFPGRHRGGAIGIWAAMAGLAVAIGPQVGGYVVERYSWETIFFINIPVGIVGLLLTLLVVKESRDTTRTHKLDLPGLVTGTAGVLFLVYALIEGGVEGWTDEVILGSFAAAAVLLLVFIVIELKRNNPMLPLHLFRNPTFAASNFVAAAVFFALFGTTFFLTLYLQNVRGFSPLEAGIRLLPFTAAILIISPIAGKLSDKHGSRWLMTVGCLYAAGGMALLLRIDPTSSYENIILPAFVVLGSGMALTMAPMTAAVMASVDSRHAGVASASTNTIRQLGGVFGIALLGALVTSSFKDRLLDTLTDNGLGSEAARSIVDRTSDNAASGGGSLETLRQQVPPETTTDTVLAQVVSAAQDSFVDAIHSGLLVAVGFMLLAALAAAIFVRSHVKQDEVAPVVTEEKKDEGRKAKKKPEPAAGGPVIDPRTEQVLQEALEPPTLGPPEVQPVPEPEVESAPEPEPVEPLVTTEWASEPLKPARRGRGKRQSAPIAPVGVSDAHYHEPAQPVGNGWVPETEVAGAVLTDDSYQQLRTLMVDLPIKAGTRTVTENLSEVALATLNYYQYGLSQPGGDALPVGITNGAQSSTREDIVILAGYLDLEKKFGRVTDSLASEQAAAHLMAALASRALQTGSPGGPGDEEFVRETVDACLRGVDPRPAYADPPPSSEPEESPAAVFRRGDGNPGTKA